MKIGTYEVKPPRVQAVQVDTSDHDGMCEIIEWIGEGAYAVGYDDFVIEFVTWAWDEEAEDWRPTGIDKAKGTDWVCKNPDSTCFVCTDEHMKQDFARIA